MKEAVCVCVCVHLVCDVLPYRLNSVGDELVDNVPRIVSPFGYTEIEQGSEGE